MKRIHDKHLHPGVETWSEESIDATRYGMLLPQPTNNHVCRGKGKERFDISHIKRLAFAIYNYMCISICQREKYNPSEMRLSGSFLGGGGGGGIAPP